MRTLSDKLRLQLPSAKEISKTHVNDLERSFEPFISSHYRRRRRGGGRDRVGWLGRFRLVDDRRPNLFPNPLQSTTLALPGWTQLPTWCITMRIGAGHMKVGFREDTQLLSTRKRGCRQFFCRHFCRESTHSSEAGRQVSQRRPARPGLCRAHRRNPRLSD